MEFKKYYGVKYCESFTKRKNRTNEGYAQSLKALTGRILSPFKGGIYLDVTLKIKSLYQKLLKLILACFELKSN